MDKLEKWKKYVSFGFTLTGFDLLEPNASTNSERISAMKKLHDAGFKTWASIEPVIELKSSAKMIADTYEFCDLYKIGLLSGCKYNKDELRELIVWSSGSNAKIYFKDSLLKTAGINREDLPENCVGMDYDMFNQ